MCVIPIQYKEKCSCKYKLYAVRKSLFLYNIYEYHSCSNEFILKEEKFMFDRKLKEDIKEGKIIVL